MDISEYRRQILARVNARESRPGADSMEHLELALDKERIGHLIGVINDNSATEAAKRGAIDQLNAVRNFSPAMRTKMPEFVNALRGQLGAPDVELRRRAVSTLTAAKDEVAQELLQQDILSNKPEEERLLPTAAAIAALGRDEKALPLSLLREVMRDAPDDASLVEAIRHLPSDPAVCDELISVMKDEEAPLAARALIPEMVSEANPDGFLAAAAEILDQFGADHDLAPWLVKGVTSVKGAEGADAVAATTEVISKLRDGAPESFVRLADALIDGDGSP